MAILPNGGPSDPGIDQIAARAHLLVVTSPLPRTRDSLDTTATLPSPLASLPNPGVAPPTHLCYEHTPQHVSPRSHGTTRLSGPRTHSNGKGAQCSFNWTRDASESEREELAYQLLASLSRPRLATVQRRVAPLLQFDLVGSLPPELSLQILISLPATALLNCALVCRRWNLLANDQTLWRNLCHVRGWEWRNRLIHSLSGQSEAAISTSTLGAMREDRDEDEGMGEEEGDDEDNVVDAEQVIHIPNENVDFDESISMNLSLQDNDLQNLIGQFVSTSSPTTLVPVSRSNSAATTITRTLSRHRVSPTSAIALIVDYKLLHQTQTLLRNRVRRGTYRLRTLPGAEGGGHTAAIYCLALWSYDSPYGPIQVLFTGSRDRTVREWDLNTNKVRRKVVGSHTGSVLSLCVTATTLQVPEGGTCESLDRAREGHKNPEAGILVSGGSDCRVVLWDLAKFKLVKALKDHQDSVLCVRVDNGRLVSCSKDQTIRTYAFPWLKPQLVLRGHRAAVNAVSIAGDLIVSGSGDRSVRVWDARTGTLMGSFEDHHARAVSSVELSPPFILSGSSDRHVRMFDTRTKRGWSTCPEFDNPTTGQPSHPLVMAQEGPGGETPASRNQVFLHSSLSQSVQQIRQSLQTTEGAMRFCSACGTQVTPRLIRGPERHSHPVRSVAVGDEFAVSGSYDCTVKVWDRTTGALVADLTNGHTGRIFCVAQDSTKIVSCGEDKVICIWDYSHGVDTSFVKL